MPLRKPIIFRIRRLACEWLVLLACLFVDVAAGEEAVSKEFRLKAAFLYNFAKFVEWPVHSFSKDDSPLVIGVYRANPFGGELEKIVRDRKINGRAVVVRVVPNADAARQTQLLFVGAGQDSRLAELKKALKGSAVLTVGESGAFARNGGMIVFQLQNDSLRFTINQGHALEAGLKISAQLQKLAAKPEGGNP